jgi:ABC-type transporter Mla subunit MlaD
LPSDSKFPSVTVKLNAYHDGLTTGTVLIDGVPVNKVRRISIDTGHNQVTEVTITLIASVDIEIDGAEVRISD